MITTQLKLRDWREEFLPLLFVYLQVRLSS